MNKTQISEILDDGLNYLLLAHGLGHEVPVLLRGGGHLECSAKGHHHTDICAKGSHTGERTVHKRAIEIFNKIFKSSIGGWLAPRSPNLGPGAQDIRMQKYCECNKNQQAGSSAEVRVSCRGLLRRSTCLKSQGTPYCHRK